MKLYVKPLVALFALAMVWGAADLSWACFMRANQPVQVWLDHIEVTIKDQVAVKTYDCTFKNPNPVVVTGATCYMELEPGAHVDNMKVEVNGKVMEAEILDVKKANEVFNDIVKRGGSPALLEYMGNQLIQTKVPQIPANGVVKVKLQYTTVLENRAGLVRLQMLNTNPKASMQPLKSASVKVKISSKTPIKNVYSPTHKVKFEEDKDADVMVTWSQEDYLPKHPFVLYYQLATEDVAATLVAHREPGEEGHFMLMMSPTIGNGAGKVTESQILPKDVVFCVDTSGSMLEGGKMEQAKAALKYCLENLRPDDRFNIVDFSTGVRAFRENELVPVNKENREAALRYASKLHARGGTAIQDALETSLSLLKESDRLKMVVFATDGFPTIGEREPEGILKATAKANKQDVRIFVFGEGFDVNTNLLDFLALNNRGEADYVLPDEDIAKRISAFYDRVGSPIMTDLKVEIDGIRVKDIYPKQIADIYRGEQVIVYGRYDGVGKKKVRLTGKFQGQTKSFDFDVDFPEASENDKASFVPRLWAGKKVDYLLNELRKSGKEEKELVDEVTYLAKRYGIVTPYTAFLMAEDIVHQVPGGLGGGGPAPAGLITRLRADGKSAGDMAAAPEREKAEMVRDAQLQNNARRELSYKGNAGAFYDQADEVLARQGRNQSSMNQMRYVAARTFYKSGKTWFEGTYDAKKDDKNVQNVKVRSDEYFRVLNSDTRVAQFLALGDVVVNVKGQWYRFEDETAK
jgi:Ca-activated chloride channel family protein